jgi:pimeloyl-ACP methyl ester carboxylesterase
VPTRFVWGSRDPVLRRRAAELTGDYVAAPSDFVELKGGHWLPEKHPDELGDLILRPL